jgi:uncharacterized protein YegL
MRRLPIYFLIDVSESMVGEQIQQVEEGMAAIVKAIKLDPHAIETVWISILVFAGQAKTLVPLQEIVSFYPPKFPIGGGTSLSKGLGHLMFELRRNVVKNTLEQKGDWKPIVFLFTDGVPTDETKFAIAEWKQNWQKSTNLIAVSFGNETDTALLGQLTDHVLQFKNATTEDYKQFFKWVTDSIKISSIGLDRSSGGFELAKIDGNTISKIDLTKHIPPPYQVDANFVVVSGKCQNTKRPYLIKYRKVVVPSNFDGLGLQETAYRLVGAFQVDSTYFDLSEEGDHSTKVNSESLMGAPTCPCCGNQFGFAVCGCGKIHCVGSEAVSICPWCGEQGQYGRGDGGGFEINRTLG